MKIIAQCCYERTTLEYGSVFLHFVHEPTNAQLTDKLLYSSLYVATLLCHPQGVCG
jgi:hypothetical protein